jgi:hypothetical protein
MAINTAIQGIYIFLYLGGSLCCVYTSLLAACSNSLQFFASVSAVLNMKTKADDDPNNDIQPDAINQPGTTQSPNRLPTPSGASQVPLNITA